MLRKYVKKPVLVDALMWNGVIDSNKDPRWFIDAVRDGVITLASSDLGIKYSGPLKLVIQMADGATDVHRGGYIVRDENGVIFTCSPDEFHDMYMEVK